MSRVRTRGAAKSSVTFPAACGVSRVAWMCIYVHKSYNVSSCPTTWGSRPNIVYNTPPLVAGILYFPKA